MKEKGYNPPPEDNDLQERGVAPPSAPQKLNKDVLVLDGIKLDKDEIEYIRSRRRLKALTQLQQKFSNICTQTVQQWFEYSSETGAGLSYSTFTHVGEFNINQRLANMRAEEFLEIREHLFEVVKDVLSEVKRAVKDVSESKAFDTILDS